MFKTSFPGKQEQDPPSGKKDYLPPLGLRLVPRGGNWVYPKNNQRCKQPQSVNVFPICGPDHLKVQLSSTATVFISPRAESNFEVTPELYRMPKLRSAWDAAWVPPPWGHHTPDSQTLRTPPKTRGAGRPRQVQSYHEASWIQRWGSSCLQFTSLSSSEEKKKGVK